MSKIIVYSKDYCPYCDRAKAFITSKGLKYTEVDITNDVKLQEECFTKANGRKTVPQIFFGNTHIGGFDDMMALQKSGKLDEIIKSELNA